MKERIKFLFYYFGFWTIFFIVARILFLSFHIETTKNLTLETVFLIFQNGIKMDFSIAGYLSVFPFLMVTFSNFTKKIRTENWIFSYTFICVFILSLIIIIDLQVFNVWNYRLDITPLKYLKTPREAFASMSEVPFLALVTSFLILLIVSSFVVYRKITSIIDSWQHEDNFPYFLPISLVLTLALIIPIRGGFQLAPMNQSSVYFSDNNFANVSAINAPWNFFSSLLYNNSDNKNPYQYLPKYTIGRVFNYLFDESGSTIKVVNPAVKQPNVIIILMESFNEKLTHLQINGNEVTSNFNKLKKEGVYFSNIYGTGEKTEKGLIGTLSGYPAQPKNSIIALPLKSEKLPSIIRSFEKNKYETSFYYGGETEFANIKQYLYANNFDVINSITNFEQKDLNSKWGAHDHVVLNKAQNDFRIKKQPFFSTILTLSSHQPFDIPTPYKYEFGNSNDTTKFYSSIKYTDTAIGEFIENAKKTDWWQNTIVVLIADHGTKIPESQFKSDDFRIPMLWIGGAIKEKGLVIEKIGSQLDFSKMILSQLNIESKDFIWSKNLLNHGTKGWANFIFNDGFGMVKPEGSYTFDNVGKKIIQQQGKVTNIEINQGKALLQRSFQDYLDK